MERTASRFAAVVVLALTAAFAPPAAARPLGVEIWTDRGDDAVYQPGDRMTLKVRTSDDAYLLVYEIDTDGRVQVLFPSRRGSGFIEGRRTLRLPEDGTRTELVVERATGQGYLVAVASREPFRDLPWYLRPYDPQAESIGYDDDREDDERDEELQGFDDDGRVVGDPFVAMERLRRRVLHRAADSDDFASGYASYFVHRQVRYPRYVCYDCHRQNRWQWWDGFDPYHASCSVFDLRVNWSWCWGPCGWTQFTPYYFYVVRSDCPPRYRSWYHDRIRLSSWDPPRKWYDLWGGPLRRYKSPPPPGYAPPPSGGAIGAGGPPRIKAPGYLDPPAFKSGTRVPVRLPEGRRGEVRDEDRGRSDERGGGAVRPGAERQPSRPAPRDDDARPSRPGVERQPSRPAPRDDDRGGASPRDERRERPAPRWEPRDRPRDEAPPPKREREPERQPSRQPERDKPEGGKGGKGDGGGGGKGRDDDGGKSRVWGGGNR